MTIQWFGYSYFRIDTKNKIIAINPYSESAAGLKPARFKSDLLLISDAQNEISNNASAILGEPLIIPGPGEVEIGGVFATGIPQTPNTVFLIQTEDISLCHLGILRKKELKEELLEQVANVDVLLVPIGGKDTINYEEAVSLINQIEPKIVIPMHYAIPHAKIKMDGLDKFLKTISKKPETLDKLILKKSNLPAETKLIVLNQQ